MAPKHISFFKLVQLGMGAPLLGVIVLVLAYLQWSVLSTHLLFENWRGHSRVYVLTQSFIGVWGVTLGSLLMACEPGRLLALLRQLLTGVRRDYTALRRALRLTVHVAPFAGLLFALDFVQSTYFWLWEGMEIEGLLVASMGAYVSIYLLHAMTLCMLAYALDDLAARRSCAGPQADHQPENQAVYLANRTQPLRVAKRVGALVVRSFVFVIVFAIVAKIWDRVLGRHAPRKLEGVFTVVTFVAVWLFRAPRSETDDTHASVLEGVGPASPGSPRPNALTSGPWWLLVLVGIALVVELLVAFTALGEVRGYTLRGVRRGSVMAGALLLGAVVAPAPLLGVVVAIIMYLGVLGGTAMVGIWVCPAALCLVVGGVFWTVAKADATVAWRQLPRLLWSRPLGDVSALESALRLVTVTGPVTGVIVGLGGLLLSLWSPDNLLLWAVIGSRNTSFYRSMFANQPGIAFACEAAIYGVTMGFIAHSLHTLVHKRTGRPLEPISVPTALTLSIAVIVAILFAAVIATALGT